MRNHSPTHLLHMAAIMMLILAPYAATPILIRSMIGRETPWLGVTLEGGGSLSFCSACSKRSMIVVMATILGQSLFYEVSHVISRIPRGDDHELLSIIDEMIWAILIYSIGREVSRDLDPIFPLDGNLIAAQDQ